MDEIGIKKNCLLDPISHLEFSTYWYTDVDIHLLLSSYTETSQNLLICAAITDNDDLIRKRIDEIRQTFSLNKSIVAALIPVNIGQSKRGVFIGSHWVSLVIKRDKDNNLYALYADSKGSSLQSSLPVLNTILVQCKIQMSFDSRKSQQHNDYDCGPWTVFNLYSLAQTGDLPKDQTEKSIEEQRQMLSILQKTKLSKEEQSIQQMVNNNVSQDDLDIFDSIPINQDIYRLNPLKKFTSSAHFDSLYRKTLNDRDLFLQKYDSNQQNCSNNRLTLEDETLDFLNCIPEENLAKQMNENFKIQEINIKDKDLRKIINFLNILEEHQRSEIDLENTFIKIGDLVGGKDGISFNDQDANCIRNKYGYINRNKQGSINLKGIYFDKLYHMRLILENCLHEKHSDNTSCLQDLKNKSNDLNNDLSNIKAKVKNILAEEEEFLSDEYKGVFNEFKGADSEGGMENIIKFASVHYYRIILNRMKLEASKFEQIDFRNKEDRYYIARILTVIGEFSRELTEDNKDITNEECRSVFGNLKRVRNVLVHCHEKINSGIKDVESITNLNKNISRVMCHLDEMITNDEIRDDYNFRELNSAIKEIKLILTKSQCDNVTVIKDNLLDREKEEAVQCDVDRIDKLINEAYETIITKNLKRKSKVLKKLNDEFQRKIQSFRGEVKENYPSELNEENEEKIKSYVESKRRSTNNDISKTNEDYLSSSINSNLSKNKEVNKIRGNLIGLIKQASKLMNGNQSNICESLNNLNKKYAVHLCQLDENDRNNYPPTLCLENMHIIEKFIDTLDVCRESRSTASVDRKNICEDVPKSQSKLDNAIGSLVKETEYLCECENRRDLNFRKRPYIIEHIVSIIGQLMRDIGDLDSKVKRMMTSTIHDDASRSAKLARNQGLTHDIFAYNKDWLGQQIQDNILPAFEHFQSVLTIMKKNECEISRVTLFSIAMSFLKLGLFENATEYFNRTISFINTHPEEIYRKENYTFNILFGIDIEDSFVDIMGTDIYIFLSRLFLMNTFIVACQFEWAYKEIEKLRENMKIKEAMNSSSFATRSLVYDVFNGLVHCLLIDGKNNEVIKLMKEMIPISDYPFFIVHLGSAYHYENRPEDAYEVFQQIIPFNFEPIMKYKALHIYVRVLSYQKNKIHYLKEASKYILEMEELYQNNVKLFKSTFDDEFLLMQYLTVRLRVQLLVDKCLHLQLDLLSFETMLHDLEKYVKEFHQITSVVKHDLRDDIRIPGMYFWFCRAYSSLINGNLPDINKEKMKLECSQYFFDKARSSLDRFRQTGRISVSNIKEMIKTADFLAYGYNKFAAREDQIEEVRNECMNKASTYMALVKRYLSKYKSSKAIHQSETEKPQPLDSLPTENEDIETIITTQFLLSKIKPTSKDAIIKVIIKNVNKVKFTNYCLTELKCDQDDLEFDKNICWLSLNSRGLNILRLKVGSS